MNRIMPLKTLKDLEIQGNRQKTVACLKLRKEVIKWMKEDKELFGDAIMSSFKKCSILESRWMKRLNITEEDLK